MSIAYPFRLMSAFYFMSHGSFIMARFIFISVIIPFVFYTRNPIVLFSRL